MDSTRKRSRCKALDQVNLLIQNATTKAHGLFWMSPSDIDENIRSLNLSKVPAKASLFDNSILEEIYDGHSSIPA